jgi:ribosomal protein S18 acetylase RimI-like enzyme
MAGNLTYSSLPIELKRIATKSLGMGFLKTLFSYNHTYHLMIKISDGIFIGFSLYHFETSKINKECVTGVIDCICVDEPYRKEGFGTLLTYGTLRKLSSYGADRVEMALKTPSMDNRDGEPGVPLIGSEELLKSLGFKFVDVRSDYYVARSKKYRYDCAFCGNNPDTCKNVLYSIDSRSN